MDFCFENIKDLYNKIPRLPRWKIAISNDSHQNLFTAEESELSIPKRK